MTAVSTATVALPENDTFSPDKSFNCGQCFRWNESDGVWKGVVGDCLITVPSRQEDGSVRAEGADNALLRRYLDTDTSYSAISDSLLSEFQGEEFSILHSALLSSRGMRILRQDFWETLCSFIISQNNNIPRIKKNVESLSRLFGKKMTSGSEDYYTFPSAEAVLDAGETGLSECRLGFRTKYILDAARRVSAGELDERELNTLSNGEVRAALESIHGVGPKVASCVMLYGLGRFSEVPVDVWMKKIFKKYFNKDLVDLGEWGGIAQQYLFYYERFIVEGKKI